MESKRVDGFLPSASGFHFANDFPSEPLFRIPLAGIPVGNASDGLCGGMAFATRDLFEAQLSPPPDTVPPAGGSPLYTYLVRRAIDSFDLPAGPVRYLGWMSLPDGDLPFGVRGLAWRTAAQEWPLVRADLDGGRLCSLGLVRAHSWNPLDLGRNHQVLAYGYDLHENAVRLRIYDPNHPNDDGVVLEVPIRPGMGPLRYADHEAPVRGFFRSRYRPAGPNALLTALGLA